MPGLLEGGRPNELHGLSQVLTYSVTAPLSVKMGKEYPVQRISNNMCRHSAGTY